LLQGIWAGLCGMPRMFGKRPKIQDVRKVSWAEFETLLRHYRISFKELLDNE